MIYDKEKFYVKKNNKFIACKKNLRKNKMGKLKFRINARIKESQTALLYPRIFMQQKHRFLMSVGGVSAVEDLQL